MKTKQKCKCESMEPTGEFKSRSIKTPFVVEFGSGRFVEASSLVMARAAACGNEGAEIRNVVNL